MYKIFFKRLFDFSFAFFGLLFLSPIFIMGIVGLSIANNGKPFFFQIRSGKNQKLFKIIKFKTMNDNADSRGNLLSDDQRLTRIGMFMRKTSLDELPQLWNVLRGEMSLIGPRPLLLKYLSLYSETQNRRHEVMPGITGWAQINGRNAISWQQKFEFDVWYVDNINFALDFRIFVKTIQKTLKREAINPDNMAYTEDFNGHN
jgi:undecaprenyl phosphate N,N'-diacetylbacillosamine 1-phosphate transferase